MPKKTSMAIRIADMKKGLAIGTKSEYTRGVHNGLELALSVLENRQPELDEKIAGAGRPAPHLEQGDIIRLSSPSEDRRRSRIGDILESDDVLNEMEEDDA